MLVWTITFVVVATASGIFGFSGISPVFSVPATICFAVFAPLSLIFLVGLKTESRHRAVIHKL
jgi:uncharacterized membrane protein YtjA (UPF0391 family)